MELKGVIFDLDGTLSDTIPLCITAFRHACETVADKSFTDKEIVAMFGPTEERMCKHAVPENWQTRRASKSGSPLLLVQRSKSSPSSGSIKILERDLKHTSLQIAPGAISCHGSETAWPKTNF